MTVPVGHARTIALADTFTVGATVRNVAAIRNLTPPVWLEAQLHPEQVQEDPTLQATLATFPTLTYRGGAQQRQASTSNAGLQELQLASLLRTAWSTRQVQQRLVGFWHDHFNVHFASGRLQWVAADYDRAIRSHATGRFADLLVAVAKTAAMMIYLDNATSRGHSPNENYARELMELHTLGVDGGYTEDDVAQAALALTGWTTTPLTGDDDIFGFAYRPEWHHTTTGLHVAGWTAPPMEGPESIQHGEGLLDHLAHHPSTARHVCGKLARTLLADEVDRALIDELAGLYLDHDTDLKPVIRRLALGPEVVARHGDKLRRPAEQLAFLLATTNATVDADGGAGSDAARGLLPAAAAMGQPPHLWPPPNGYPDTASYWAASGSVLARWNTTLALAGGRIRGVAADHQTLRAATAGMTVSDAIAQLADRLLARPVTAEDRETLLAFTGNDPDVATDQLPDRTFANLVALLLLCGAAHTR